MKLKKMILPLLAVVLLLCAAVPSVMAYFTTYTRAKGGYTIRLTGVTSIDEKFDNWQKFVTIKNEEGEAVFIRAKAYVGENSGIELNYTGKGWSAGDGGWWYYYPAVIAGQSSGPLVISISNYPEALDEGDNFNVIVIYESATAVYNADGTPDMNCWNEILDRGGEQG